MNVSECTLLDYCSLESARLHTHMFPLNRKPKYSKVIKGFYVGDADVLALSSHTIMCSNNTIYKDA